MVEQNESSSKVKLVSERGSKELLNLSIVESSERDSDKSS